MPEPQPQHETRPVAPEAPPKKVWRGRIVRVGLVVAVLAGLAVFGLRGRLPALDEILDAVGGADPAWLLVAAFLQAASIVAFAFQQRYLLGSLGARLRRGSIVAITLAGTALSISVPAGPAVSTAFTIRKYRQAGATREVAAACVIVSGLASIGGLALLYVGGGLVLLARGPATLRNWQPLLIVAGMAALVAVAVVLGRRHARRAKPHRTGTRSDGGRIVTYVRKLLRSARDAWQEGASLRAVDWAVALGYGAAKWLADVLCLAAVALALDLPVGLTALATIYLSVQIVRQVPVTPGGVGVVEIALIAGFTAAGVSTAGATAAVLIYRILSTWILIPIGGVAALTLPREPATA